MGLRINQNIGAMVAHQYLQRSESSFGKAVERLSSGLRVVRAADDPAALGLSEKYRAQVEGLNQAINNAKDGISLVQTAEGALDEVSSVLRNMRNLALHAANTGANDSAAIAADQDQISYAIATLNRIANTTAFGSKKLLDGSAGVSASTSDSDVTFISGGSLVQSGTYAVNITNAAVQGEVRSAAARTVAKVTAAAGGGGDTVGASTLTFSGTLIGASNVVLNVAGGTDIDELVTAITNDASLQALDISAVNNGGTLEITQNRLSGGGGAELTVTSSSASLTTVSGIAQAGTAAGTAAATSASKLSSAESLTFRNANGSYVQVALTVGQSISSAISQINTALDNAGIKITASFDNGSQKFKFTNDDYGSSTTVANTIESSLAGGIKNTGVAANASTQYNIALATGIVDKTDGEDVAGTVGTYAATGQGVMLTGNSGTPISGLVLRIAGGASGAQGTVTVAQNSMEFQVGAFQNQQVSLSLSDMRTNQLGASATGTSYMSTINVASIDVSAGSGSGAQDAIIVLDAAISQVSEMRAEMGSFQKDVLETTVRNLGVAKQNMAASESVIRDADMAEEMVNFSRAQILQSTGMAMLAQANMAPQSVLKLFS